MQTSSVVVDDLDFVGIAIQPFETDSPLVVHPDAVLAELYEVPEGGVKAGLTAELVDGGTIVRFGDWLARLTSRCEPVRLGSLDFRERLLWSVAEGGASEEVRNIGDVAAVFLAPKDVDVVVLHASSSSRRL
jgi:hypothetical protein